MQREKFINGLNSGIKFTDAEQNEIVKKAVEHRGIETTGIICMEEMAELQQQISKYLRGCGDRLLFFGRNGRCLYLFEIY